MKDKPYTYTTAWRIATKQKLLAYKGGKCSICGYDKNVPGAYDFHHRNPKEKDFGISRYQNLNWKKLLKEVDKCDLVCKNCHAEIHDDPQRRGEILKGKEEWEKRKTKTVECLCCKKKFKQSKNRQKYCSPSCCSTESRKVKRPTKSELARMLTKETWVAMGKKFGVSDNAVRKWAKTYELL